MKKTFLYLAAIVIIGLLACKNNNRGVGTAVDAQAAQSADEAPDQTPGQKLDTAIQKTSRKALEVKDGADVLVDKAGNKIKDAAKTVKEGVKDAAAKTKEKAADAAAKTKEAVQDAAKKTKETVKSAAAKAAEKVEQEAKAAKEKLKN